jgi:hypothetical protein
MKERQKFGIVHAERTTIHLKPRQIKYKHPSNAGSKTNEHQKNIYAIVSSSGNRAGWAMRA